MSKILIISDAWVPQINGVVTTLSNIYDQGKQNKDTVTIVHPGTFGFTVKNDYPNLSFFHVKVDLIKNFIFNNFDHIHIATPETCLGYQFLRACRKFHVPFTCAYHTKFPEFLDANYHIPTAIGWRWISHVLKDADNIITTTTSMVEELKGKISNTNITPWTRGVNRDVFKVGDRCNNIRKICGSPIIISVGRISTEKGLEDFCKVTLGERATKIIIGDGPDKPWLEKKYPDVMFIGYQTADQLVKWYQSADCFVFTSKKDTFGAVMLEAMACGTPIAAYPVTGPIDIIKNGMNGWLDNDIGVAIQKCLDIDRKKVYNESIQFSWAECYQQFKNALVKR